MSDLKFRVITLLSFGMAIALTGIVCADQGVPPVPETQGLVTSTYIDIVGMATETDAGVWSINYGGIPMNGADPVLAGYPNWAAWGTDHDLAQSSGGYVGFLADWNWWLYGQPNPDAMHVQDMLNALTDTPSGYLGDHSAQAKDLLAWLQNQGSLNDIPLKDQEIRYTTAYDAYILAQAGHMVLSKSMDINTGNKVAATQSNLKANTLLTYVATGDAGNVVGSENLLIDGTGNPTRASDRMLCPFASQPSDVIPAFCNIIQTGNAYDLTVGTVTSGITDRFVGTDATIPVQLDYSFSVTPYGTSSGSIPAMGSTSAYIKAHIQEARNWSGIHDNVNGPPNQPLGYPTAIISQPSQKAEDLTYNEQSSARGTITSFQKVIAYRSGRSLL
jgi:hypothetical protein